jgi:hypothetical protein
LANTVTSPINTAIINPKTTMTPMRVVMVGMAYSGGALDIAASTLH